MEEFNMRVQGAGAEISPAKSRFAVKYNLVPVCGAGHADLVLVEVAVPRAVAASGADVAESGEEAGSYVSCSVLERGRDAWG